MTLLGKFYSRIYGSVEYLASESLLFILNKSKSARNVLESYINGLSNNHLENLHYVSQNAGLENERPDISGFDADNLEKLIIETKFWASLTENQPMTYLNRIKKCGGVLVFICPSRRKVSLFNEVAGIISTEDSSFSIDKSNYCFTNQNTSFYIVTWDQVLLNLKAHFTVTNDENTLSDIEQLIGLCETIDTDSFLPVKKEDLSPEIPRRILSYTKIVDKVIDNLSSQIGLSTKGLKTSPQVWGYRRYARLNDFTIGLDMNLEYWGKCQDTPFWIEISQNWETNSKIETISKLIQERFNIEDQRLFNAKPYLPLLVICDHTEDQVIEHICSQITSFYKVFQECLNTIG